MKNESYHYKECGLSNIYLKNGFTITDSPRGEMVSISDIKGLHAAIGEDIASQPDELNGAEIRYLRKEMDLSQRALAEILSVKEITVRKWECGGSNINTPTAKLLCLYYLSFLYGSAAIHDYIEKVNQRDKQLYNRVQINYNFEAESHVWHQKAC